MRSRIVGLGPVLVSWTTLAPGQSISVSGSERDSLKGLKAVSVIVGGPSPDAGQDGLTSDSIRADIEWRLRRAGIEVPTTVREITFPESRLLLTADTRRDNGLYAIALKVQLQQLLNSLTTGQLVFGSTWERGGVVTLGARNLGEVRGMLADYVDQFINDFRAANPPTGQ